MGSRSDNSSVHPDDTRAVFATQSTGGLVARAALYELSSHPRLVGAVSRTLLRVSSPDAPWVVRHVVAPPLLMAVKSTVFPLFCAGEHARDLDRCAAALLRPAAGRVRCIFDHSTEEQETPDAWDGNLQNKIALLHGLARRLPASAAFVSVKPTALVSPGMLERVTAVIEEAAVGAVPRDVEALRPLLSADDAALLDSGIARIGRLCAAARRTFGNARGGGGGGGVALLLDAEQSHRQPAIDVIARELGRRYNQPASTADDPAGGAALPVPPAVVYNTYQMYLRGSLETLERERAAARDGGFVFAAKVVRGAYLAAERARARELAKADPVHATIERTHISYDEAVTQVIDAIADADAPDAASDPGAALVVASHNADSLLGAQQHMRARGLAPGHRCVAFAQIHGMSDNLTAAAGLSGFNSLKLLCYGDFGEVLPWLLRRLQENQDVFGAMASQRHLFLREARRRVLWSPLSRVLPAPTPSRWRPGRPSPGGPQQQQRAYSSTSGGSKLSHLSADGSRPRMVNVAEKAVTVRTAHARTTIALPPEAVAELARLTVEGQGEGPVAPKGKGPIFTTATIAGVMGAKRTSELIPLCHPIPLEDCDVAITSRNGGRELRVDCRVATSSKTGVEMEALAGCSVAALCVYDMLKAVSHDIVLAETKLMAKQGGKRPFEREEEKGEEE